LAVAIEVLLFSVVLVLGLCCVLLTLMVLRNHAQIQELRAKLMRLEQRTRQPPPETAAPMEGALEPPETGGNAAPALRLIRPAVLEAEIRELAAEGRMLEAVSRYRAATGASLRDAHAAVRQMLEG
jgi:hypothetical protein